MKPEIHLKECPPELIEKAEEEIRIAQSKHYYASYPDIIHQEIRAELLYTYLYDAKKVCEENKHTPEYIIIADMKAKKWDTYSVERQKWGKAMLLSLLSWGRNSIEDLIDKETYGVTLKEMQFQVNSQKTSKRNETKRQRVKEAMQKAKELPAAFVKWAANHVTPFLLYKAGKNTQGYCTRCQKQSDFEKKLKNNTKRKCPNCGSICNVRTEKTAPETAARTFCYVQRTNTGIMVRFVKYTKHIKNARSHPQDIIREDLRVVIDRGNKQQWYERRDWPYGDNEWKLNRCVQWVKSYNSPHREEINPHYGEAARVKNRFLVYKKNSRGIIADSNLRYIDDWKDFLKFVNKKYGYNAGLYGFIDLYEVLHRYPQIESMWKLGLTRLAVSLIRVPHELNKSKELHKALGISKETMRYILENKMGAEIDINTIQKIIHIEKNFLASPEITIEAAKLLPLYGMDRCDGLSIKKAVRYIKKTRNVALFLDYLSIAKQNGYDLTDDFVAFPKNLKAAHDQAIAVRDEAKNKKALEEAKKDDAGIARVYKKIRKRYSYKKGEYIIRPARSNYEIVKEGQTLHHCVGGGNFRDKMLREETFIVFLRKAAEPDKPYYTIEIDAKGEICQAYGKYDKKTDWDVVEPILNEYEQEVKKRCQRASYRKAGTNVTSVAETA